jgi:predicted phage terminase large subunit-like protein
VSDLTAAHIEGFFNLFLKKDCDVPTEVPECHREWWEMCCSSYKFVAIAAPRGHAKSTAITQTYTLANICMRKRHFILIVSDTEQQASFFLNDIKKALTENEDLVKVFGVRGLTKDTDTDFIVEFDDGHQIRVIAKGSEQKLRGLKWDNKRPDLIVCDDMENDEIVMNDERRLKFRNWFSSALLPCRSINGIVRYVGTILHMDAMLERLMPRENDKRNIHTELSVKSPYQSIWQSIKYKAHNPDFSEVLWPDRWSEKALKAERDYYISQGQSDKYSQEYLNVPIDEANSYFKRSDFIPMQEAHFKSNKVFYVGADLAFATEHTVKGDWTVFVVGAVDEEGILNIVEVIRERMDSVEAIGVIMDLQKRYDPAYFFFEKGAMTNSVLPHLKVAMLEENRFVTLELFARIVDKISFAQTIRARMRSKRVRFDKRSNWFGDLETECMRFPRDRHDDQVDALAILGRGVEKFFEAPTNKELEEEAYLEDMINSDVFQQGRSEMTGY